MNKEYIIGVDGGGTKTDYLIFTVEGEFVDSLRTGSRSHEVLSGGFCETEEKLLKDLEDLLQKNNIAAKDIAAAVFGMAGVDTSAQKDAMSKMVGKAGFQKFAVSNDSLLGIKAGCPSGIGICCINGTGTVVTGIDDTGEILQVGGIGIVTGDYAGGIFIAALTVKAAYDYYYRCGVKTILTDRVMQLFGLKNQKELYRMISDEFYSRRNRDKELITILFDAANAGDEAAVEIVQEIARQQAKSVAGCIKNLSFQATPEVVLAGSVWTKSNCPLLLSYFTDCISQYTGIPIKPVLLESRPVAGAILWALELANSQPVTKIKRETILNYLKEDK
jgi:N-acetylglucosamine kinase-like BadF-type ATPase